MRTHPLLYSILFLATAAGAATIGPKEAESGHAFTLTVYGKTQLCMPIFSRQSAEAVKTGSLHLSVMAENNPLGKCTAGDHDYQVDFDIPALKAGEYAVSITLQPPCAYTEPRCLVPVVTDSAGTLTVRDSAKLVYQIKPKLTPSLKSFPMRVIHSGFKCDDVFTNLTVAVRGWQIFTTYTKPPHNGGICPAVITDYGPVFTVPALEAGTYQVFATETPYCSNGLCPPIILDPLLAGSLEARGQAEPFTIWVEPGKVAAGMAGTLQLHSSAFTCNDVMQNKQATIGAKDGVITLSYSMTRTKILCPDTIFVHHEDFAVAGLAVGMHPIVLKPAAECPSNSILCGDAAGAKAVDTVTAESSLGVAGKRSGARRAAGMGMELRWRGEPADADGRIRNQAR